VYSSIQHYFVIIAPEATHVDKQTVTNFDTYAKRGWCRLEQWARMASTGDDSGVLRLNQRGVLVPAYQPTSLHPMRRTAGSPRSAGASMGASLEVRSPDSQRIPDALLVCEGDFADPSDKHKLVDTILGLYALVLVSERDTRDSSLHSDSSLRLSVMTQQIRSHFERIFPEAIFDDLPRRVEAWLEEAPLEVLGKLRGALSMNEVRSKEACERGLRHDRVGGRTASQRNRKLWSRHRGTTVGGPVGRQSAQSEGSERSGFDVVAEEMHIPRLTHGSCRSSRADAESSIAEESARVDDQSCSKAATTSATSTNEPPVIVVHSSAVELLVSPK
jgi:hypothetical protein